VFIRFTPNVDLFAYEVLHSLENCKLLFPFIGRKPELKTGSHIDFYDKELKEWKIGKIKKYLESTNEVIVQVEKAKKLDKEIKLPNDPHIIAPYKMHTAEDNDIKVLPLYHRYKTNDGTMKYFGIPKLIAIPIWITCSQIIKEVTLQVKDFVRTESSRRVQIIAPGNVSDIPSIFTISMTDMTNNMCAICSSKAICLQLTRCENCLGCNLMKYPETQIKSLVNYFGNVALCVTWKDKAYYTEPQVTKRQIKPEQTPSKLTLEECLNVFTSKEKIPKYKCDKCHNESTANFQVLITKLPDILILHLKRFLFADNYTEKLDIDISFPIQKLNMSKWFYNESLEAESSKSSHTEYDLYAVTNHHSYTAAGGHYTAFIQSAEFIEAWVECDDSELKGLNTSRVITKDGYLLFYKRRMLSASNIINLTYKSFT